MIIYQIVIKGDARSEEYAAISRASFQPAIDAGFISEIKIFDAITPSSENFEEHVSRYNWAPSLMHADKKSGKKIEDHSPTEKAGMCSHWELMRMQSLTPDRFFIIEHDTFLLQEHLDVFGELIDYSLSREPMYANIGLFMGCYSFTQATAAFQYSLLTKQNFPINCGPYCTLQRLFRTYSTWHLEKADIRFFGKEVTVIHPWADCDTLGFGRECGIYFNNKDPDKKNSIPTPTTQVISKKLKVSQDHHTYIDLHIEQPWLRHNYFHIIE